MTFCSFSNEKSTRLLHEIICPPAAIERGVMQVCYPCDIFISVKVSLLLSFQVWISALEEDRKTMAFDLRVVAFTRSCYKIVKKSHNSYKFCRIKMAV